MKFKNSTLYSLSVLAVVPFVTIAATTGTSAYAGASSVVSVDVGNVVKVLVKNHGGCDQNGSTGDLNGKPCNPGKNKASIKGCIHGEPDCLATKIKTLLTPTPTPTGKPSECVFTDVKGRFEYEGNHMSKNPVVGYFDNVATKEECDDDVTIHVFGSKHKAPEGDGWLESQEHITSQTYTIPQGATNHKITFDVPNKDYCWYQVEATRTKEVKQPPYYNGNEMIDYVFVKDTDSCPEATPTPTATPAPKAEATPTPTPKQEVLGTTKGGQPIYEAPKHVPQTPQTGAGAIALASLIPSGIAGILLRRKSN